MFYVVAKDKITKKDYLVMGLKTAKEIDLKYGDPKKWEGHYTKDLAEKLKDEYEAMDEKKKVFNELRIIEG